MKRGQYEVHSTLGFMTQSFGKKQSSVEFDGNHINSSKLRLFVKDTDWCDS